MAATTSDPALQAGLESKNIPALSSLVPSIFTPLEDDLLDPFEPPENRVQRLQRIIANIDAHEKRATDNAMWMVEREKRRIIMEAKRKEEALDQPETQLRINPDETETIIENMRAAPKLGKDYNVADAELQPNHAIFQQEFTHREDTTRQLMLLVENAYKQIEEYKVFMKATKDFYQERLKSEIAVDEGFGKRPELLKRV